MVLETGMSPILEVSGSKQSRRANVPRRELRCALRLPPPDVKENERPATNKREAVFELIKRNWKSRFLWISDVTGSYETKGQQIHGQLFQIPRVGSEQAVHLTVNNYMDNAISVRPLTGARKSSAWLLSTSHFESHPQTWTCWLYSNYGDEKGMCVCGVGCACLYTCILDCLVPMYVAAYLCVWVCVCVCVCGCRHECVCPLVCFCLRLKSLCVFEAHKLCLGDNYCMSNDIIVS